MKLTHSGQSLRLAAPFTHARGSWSQVDAIVAGIEHDGRIGHGEGVPSQRRGDSCASAREFLDQAAGVLGTDPFAFAERAPRLRHIAERLGPQPAAHAALDIALHDLCGQLAGLPLWRLLGLRRHGPPTTWTISLADPDTMARDAEHAHGFHRLKIKLGGGDGLDLDRLRAVRTVTTTPLVVDVNERWTLAEAQDILPRLAEFDVVLVEQPLPAHDPDAELLARQSSLPIYLDEECSSAADVARSAGRAHGVNLKLSKCGGIRELLAAAVTARAHGLHIMIGCDLESSLGITAAAHLASIADHVDLDGNLLLAEDPWNGVDLVDGVQIPPADPGLGVHALAALRITEGVGNAPNGP